MVTTNVRHLNRSVDTGYWRVFFDQELIERADSLRETRTVLSTGINIHLDIYPQSDPDAPVIIINHGSMSYCRMFIPIALAFYDKGFTVIVPDQKGHGFSTGSKGDFTITDCAQNILDVALWANQHYRGTLFMAGVSIGGSLTYYAAAAGAPAKAIACLNLFDLSTSELAIQLTRNTELTSLLIKFMPLLPLLGRLRLPLNLFIRTDQLGDAKSQEALEQWLNDPIPARSVTLRALASHICTPPAIPFEDNEIPVLVLNQGADPVLDPQITRSSYERLGGIKSYREFREFAHWSIEDQFWQVIVDACCDWFFHWLPDVEVHS